MINYNNLPTLTQWDKNNIPFNHSIIDNFFYNDIAEELSKEFPEYNSSKWYVYDNSIENKRALNDWNSYPSLTYKVLTELISSKMLTYLSTLVDKTLYIDPGLHGGGWHMHGAGGNLNPHLDYSIHPKLGMQRKLNIIIYLSKELKSEYGGHLGLYAKKGPKLELVKEVEPLFNRAVLFDTTQDSWHGMSRVMNVPAGIYRKSLAVYYLCAPPTNVDPRTKALFFPRENQQTDDTVLNLIKLRSSENLANTVYKN